MQQIGIIGFGNMGSAIARGLRAQHPGLELGILEPNSEARQRAESELGAISYIDAPDRFFRDCETVVLAIKPQDLDPIADELRAHSTDAALISVLAGTPTERIAAAFDTQRVARFMPSLAASVGKSLVGVAFAAAADKSLRETALTVAETIGRPLEVPEHLMAAITGVSGSGLAYAFTFAHALAMGGVSTGLKYDDALAAAVMVLDGAAEVLRATGEHPLALASKVSSPAGTTITGLTALERGAFTATVIEAVEQAAHRANELERTAP